MAKHRNAGCDESHGPARCEFNSERPPPCLGPCCAAWFKSLCEVVKIYFHLNVSKLGIDMIFGSVP